MSSTNLTVRLNNITYHPQPPIKSADQLVVKQLYSEGSVVSSSQNLAADGAVGAPSYSFNSDTDSGMYRIGTNNIGLAVGASKIVDVSATGIKLPTTGGTASALGYYEEGTFDLTFAGFTVPPTLTVSFTRCGNVVTLKIPAYQGANPGAIASSSPTAIPSRLRAPIVQFLYTRVEDLGALTNGMFEVGTDGVVQVGLEGLTGPSAFGAGVAGWTQAVVIIYNI